MTAFFYALTICFCGFIRADEVVQIEQSWTDSTVHMMTDGSIYIEADTHLFTAPYIEHSDQCLCTDYEDYCGDK